MKKIIFLSIVLTAIVLTSCKKSEYTPDGPTDIRIHNVSSLTYDSVVVINTDLEINEYGTIDPGEQTEYKRFEKAYPREQVNMYINSVSYEFPPDDSVRVLLQQGKFTYQLDVDTVAKSISIHVIADAPLDDV
ncbi:MAG: hypothetical protein J7K53_08180 [Bacteroidales bacterium]|nr:hypothetical protein [Bacteroidales bacterium]